MYKPFSDLSQTVILNSIVSIIFAIIVILFSLVRAALTAQIWGEAAFGFLAIAIGILPFISSTHGGVTMVSRYNLYDKVYHRQYDEANQAIANLKVQYFFFGSIYGIIAVVLAFAFPFFFNQQGMIDIHINNSEVALPWWQTTFYILSNCIEALSNYFIFPISIIIFFIIKKSYITNSINSLLSVILNGIVITLLLLEKTGVIHLSFIIMNIIISALIGIRIILLVSILHPIRNKMVHWYEKKKINNKKISKDMIISICTEYFKQINTDLYAIVFIILTSVLPHNNTPPVQLFHEGHGGGLEVGGIYVIFLTLITYSYEIVHTIVDAAIPSMAEHVTVNKKIHTTFFKRYNSLAILITTYAITTFIFSALFSSSILMNIEHIQSEEIILMFIITIPFFIDIRASSYDHIVPVCGEFKKILFFNMIKSAINIVMTATSISILAFSIKNTQVAVFSGIIFGWTASSIFYFIANKRFVDQLMDVKQKFVLSECLKQNAYLIFSLVFMIIICILGTTLFDINELIIHKIKKWSYLIIALIGIINFPICFINMKYSCKPEYNYYLREWICFKEHLKELTHPVKCECDCHEKK